jgi:adenylate kinase family enzyme
VSDPPARWWFVGCSGSGKSSYARALAEVIGGAHHELDATFHQADWSPLPAEEFRRRVTAFVDAERWTIDGGYRAVRSLVLARAEVIVCLDLSKPLVMRQVVRRTVRRWWRREELWNGNRESFLSMWRWDPEKSIIRWAWTTHGKRHREMEWLALVGPALGKNVVRVRSHAEARTRLAALTGVDEERFLR